MVDLISDDQRAVAGHELNDLNVAVMEMLVVGKHVSTLLAIVKFKIHIYLANRYNFIKNVFIFIIIAYLE